MLWHTNKMTFLLNYCFATSSFFKINLSFLFFFHFLTFFLFAHPIAPFLFSSSSSRLTAWLIISIISLNEFDNIIISYYFSQVVPRLFHTVFFLHFKKAQFSILHCELQLFPQKIILSSLFLLFFCSSNSIPRLPWLFQKYYSCS